MTSENQLAKHAILVELVKPKWNKWPLSQWPRQRFVVCGLDDPEALPEMISEVISEDAAYKMVQENKFDHVSNLAGHLLGADPDESNQAAELTYEITRTVMRELGIAVVEAVAWGKSGRLPESQQPAARFWVISLREGAIRSTHESVN